MSTAPDYVQPVVGWRVWNAVDDGGETRLSSVIYKSTVWPERTALVAVCHRSRIPLWPFDRRRHEDVPVAGCGCGIHAATLPTIRRYLPEQFSLSDVVPVVGRVSLWGVVHEFDRGWRASRAYPECLYVATADLAPERAARVVDGLSCYGVPVYAINGADPDALIEEVSALAAAA